MFSSPHVNLPRAFRVFLLSLAGLGLSQSAEPANYYALVNQPGLTLRAALHQTIKGHTSITYGAATDALKITDQDPTDSTRVILVYSRRSELKTNFINGNTTTTAWNKEHLWPQSYGIDAVVPMTSDLFNLRPEDANVNSTRANLYYDETSVAENRVFPAEAEAPATSRDSNSWEPPIVIKGDVARSNFYMDVRYEGDVSGEVDLQLTDNVSLIVSHANYMGRLTTLLLWSLKDPVSPEERLRNEAVYSVQKNRNPFIDHPEWVTKVFGDPLQFTITKPSETQITLTWWAALPSGVPEMSTSLSGSWTPITTTPVTSGVLKSLTLNMVPGRTFFRLRYNAPDGP